MRSATPVALLLALCALAASLVGCDFFSDEGEKTEKNPPLPNGAVLAASMDGNPKREVPGVWLFDAETLERDAVVETDSRVPYGVAFSPNYERWYLSWRIGSALDSTVQNVLATLDPASRRVEKRTSTSDPSVGGGQLAYEPANKEVVSYGNGSGRVQFFDPETLKLVRDLSVGTSENSYIPAAAVAEERGTIYFSVYTEGDGIYVYDVAARAVTETLSLAESPLLQQSEPSDLALSPNERYLFGTTFRSPGGPGRFFMMDVETGELLFEGQAGSYSNLAVDPNGRYAYIDCPAGGARRLLPPTGQLLRFDVEQREMEVFVESAEALGLDDSVLQATQITMLPNGEAVVIRNRGGDPALLKLDAATGSVLATYTRPRDDQGQAIASVRQLHFGIASK